MPNWKYIKYDIEERLEPIVEKFTAAREWLNERKTFSTIIIIGLFAVVVLISYLSLSAQDEELKAVVQNKSWFYDLNTGKLFTVNAGQLPPLEAPSGPLSDGQPAGVKAYVFNYGGEPNEENQFIGYIETFKPEAKEKLLNFVKSKTNNIEEAMKLIEKGRLVRRTADKQWVPADSNEGRAVINKAFRPNKEGEYPNPSQPK